VLYLADSLAACNLCSEQHALVESYIVENSLVFTVYFYVISKKKFGLRNWGWAWWQQRGQCRHVPVRPSHAGILSKRLNTSNFFHHLDRVATRSVSITNVFDTIPTGTPRWGVQCGGMKKITIFDQYLALSLKRHKIGHSYYRTPIGTGMQSIECCCFQWPWMT